MLTFFFFYAKYLSRCFSFQDLFIQFKKKFVPPGLSHTWLLLMSQDLQLSPPARKAVHGYLCQMPSYIFFWQLKLTLHSFTWFLRNYIHMIVFFESVYFQENVSSRQAVSTSLVPGFWQMPRRHCRCRINICRINGWINERMSDGHSNVCEEVVIATKFLRKKKFLLSKFIFVQIQHAYRLEHEVYIHLDSILQTECIHITSIQINNITSTRKP